MAFAWIFVVRPGVGRVRHALDGKRVRRFHRGVLGFRADRSPLHYRLLPWLVGAVILALSRPAHADAPHRLELTWTAPSTCPTQAEVAAAVERLVAHAPQSPEPLRVSTRVERDRTGFTAHIAVRDGDHERLRTLHGDTCKAIADASAVVLALAIDPNALLDAPAPTDPVALEPTPTPAPTPTPPAEPPPPPDPSPEPEPPPAPTPKPTPRPAPPRLSPWVPHVHARLQGAASLGALPGVAPRLVGGLEASWGVPRLVASIDLGPTIDTAVNNAADRGGSFSLWTAALDGCFAWGGVGPAELGGCLGLQAGRMAAESFGVSSPGQGSATWLAVEGGARGRVPLTDALALDVDVFAFFPLRRPTFVIEGRGDVYQPSAAGLRLAAGLSYGF